MKYVYTIILAILCSLGTVISAGETEKVKTVGTKIAPLKDKTVLKLGFIGRMRSYPTELRTVWSLTKEPDAEACFLKLTEEKNSCTALYGLIGLKLIKSKKFDDVKAALAKREDKVKTTQGCYNTSHSVKQLAESVAKATIPAPPKK